MSEANTEANAAIDELRNEETLLRFDDGPPPTTLEDWNRLWEAGYLQYSDEAVKVLRRKGVW